MSIVTLAYLIGNTVFTPPVLLWCLHEKIGMRKATAIALAVAILAGVLLGRSLGVAFAAEMRG